MFHLTLVAVSLLTQPEFQPDDRLGGHSWMQCYGRYYQHQTKALQDYEYLMEWHEAKIDAKLPIIEDYTDECMYHQLIVCQRMHFIYGQSDGGALIGMALNNARTDYDGRVLMMADLRDWMGSCFHSMWDNDRFPQSPHEYNPRPKGVPKFITTFEKK